MKSLKKKLSLLPALFDLGLDVTNFLLINLVKIQLYFFKVRSIKKLSQTGQKLFIFFAKPHLKENRNNFFNVSICSLSLFSDVSLSTDESCSHREHTFPPITFILLMFVSNTVSYVLVPYGVSECVSLPTQMETFRHWSVSWGESCRGSHS